MKAFQVNAEYLRELRKCVLFLCGSFLPACRAVNRISQLLRLRKMIKTVLNAQFVHGGVIFRNMQGDVEKRLEQSPLGSTFFAYQYRSKCSQKEMLDNICGKLFEKLEIHAKMVNRETNIQIFSP